MDSREITVKRDRLQYFFENLDLIPDTSAGQRGFNRNLERVTAQLIEFYHLRYPRDAQRTMNKIIAQTVEEKLKQWEADKAKKKAEQQKNAAAKLEEA